MGCKMIAAITWTQVELKGLLEDEESHVNYERAKRHLGLHPFHLTDLNAALREILTSTINSYDSKLKGIILSYKNPKLLSRMGTVLYDTCYIHVDIEADFYVFRPSVGDTLKGIVNKKSQDHVGILVHKTFNATIPRPDNDDDWPGHSIHIGQEIRFTVTCLDFKDRLPYIRGSMDAQDYLRGCQTFGETFAGGTKKVDVKPKKSKFLYDDDDECNADQETGVVHIDYSTEENVSHKKSKKLKRESSEDVVRVKSKKKHKIEGEVLPPEDEPSSYERNTSAVRDGGSSEEESSPGELKLKREISEDKITTKKKKKKSKVKAEETLSETEYEALEASQRNLEEVGEDVSPKKAKKLKKEKTEDKIRSKTKTKTEFEVEIIESEGDFDFYKPNESRKMKDGSGEGKIKKKHRIKTEVLSSETESELNNTKQSKRMKVESNDERSSKKYKVKPEVLLSDDESFVNEGNQSVRNKRESIDEKSKKKHRIKAEILTAESDD